jgi:hypothetical protein
VDKAQGQAARAVIFWAAAHAVREAISCHHPSPDQEKVDSYLEDLRADLGGEAFTAAWTEGLAMSMDQAIAAALAYEAAFKTDPVGDSESSVRPASG